MFGVEKRDICQMNIRGHMRLVYVAKNAWFFQTRSCAKNITFFLFCFISPFHFPDLFFCFLIYNSITS